MDTERINPYGRFQLRFVDRVEEGREYLMSRTFSGVKEGAQDEAVFQLAMTLADLQTKDLKHVNRINGYEIVGA